MKPIKRDDLFRMYKYKEYIQGCCEHATEVYTTSIYFFGGSGVYITWINMLTEEDNQYSTQTRNMQDLILAGINGACKTKFVFED